MNTGKAQRTELSPRERVAASARIVVKVGTNVHHARRWLGVSIGVLYGIAESLANLRRAGREVLARLLRSGRPGRAAPRPRLAASELALDAGLRRRRPEPADEHVRRRLR